jgi:ribosomal protein S18 acetylase RimI-like enzyme
MVHEVVQLEEAMKAKAMAKDEKYYYVLFLGTDEGARGKGLCSRILRGYQERAGKGCVLIWMEAGTEYCRKIYERLGFGVVEEILVGKGKADREGRLRDGEEGFFIWGMI